LDVFHRGRGMYIMDNGFPPSHPSSTNIHLYLFYGKELEREGSLREKEQKKSQDVRGKGIEMFLL
jgi:hypothetical protein